MFFIYSIFYDHVMDFFILYLFWFVVDFFDLISLLILVFCSVSMSLCLNQFHFEKAAQLLSLFVSFLFKLVSAFTWCFDFLLLQNDGRQMF